MRNLERIIELYPESHAAKCELKKRALRRFLLIYGVTLAAIGLLWVGLAHAQVVTRTLDPSLLKSRRALVVELADGGVRLDTVCGELWSTDGQFVISGCQAIHIEIQSPTRRTLGLQLLTLAGQEWLKREKLQNDGGVP